MCLKSAIASLIRLSMCISLIGDGYCHSQPLSMVRSELGDELGFTLFDWGLLGAISESSLLLIGDTDRGKTDYARIIMTALFGREEEGWHKTNVDIDFGALSYSNTDFSAIREGKSSEQLFSAQNFLEFPGLIWDEPNRAPAKLLNKMLHILEKHFHLENNKTIFSGRQYLKSNGRIGRYQYHILAMNEGAQFHGISEMDRALRRRNVIEIPLDIFPATMADKIQMGRIRTKALHLRPKGDHFDEVISVLNALEQIPVSANAEQLKLYLQSMDYCMFSLSKSKRGINFGQHICSGSQQISTSGRNITRGACHYLASYPHKMCPNTYGLSDGIAIRLMAIARAHALMRAAKTLYNLADCLNICDIDRKFLPFKPEVSQHQQKLLYRKISQFVKLPLLNQQLVPAFVDSYLKNLTVEPQDLYAVLPFVIYSKMDINADWVEENFQGSRWFAINAIVNLAYERVIRFQNNHPEIFARFVDGHGDSDNHVYQQLVRNDIWLQRSLEAYKQYTNSIGPSGAVFELLK